MAKRGSIPCEPPAIMLMVPVGAIVVTVALRIAGYFFAKTLSLKAGKLPFSLPSSTLIFLPSSAMNFISCSAVSRAFFEL